MTSVARSPRCSANSFTVIPDDSLTIFLLGFVISVWVEDGTWRTRSSRLRVEGDADPANEPRLRIVPQTNSHFAIFHLSEFFSASPHPYPSFRQQPLFLFPDASRPALRRREKAFRQRRVKHPKVAAPRVVPESPPPLAVRFPGEGSSQPSRRSSQAEVQRLLFVV